MSHSEPHQRCHKVVRSFQRSLMSYHETFEEILSKPGMYVGNTSIVRMKAFMDGYIHANWQKGVRDLDDVYFGFQPWVIKWLALSITRDWATSICYATASEEGAFELTKKLWSEYKAELADKLGTE